MTKISPQVRRVYAEHGLAMGEAQLLERYIALAVLAASSHTNPEHYEREERQLSGLTLGQLVRRFDIALSVPHRFQARLAAAVTLRNHLAHRYLVAPAGCFDTSVGRTRMMRELEQMSNEFYDLWGYLDEAFMIWFRRAGASPEQFIHDLKSVISEA